MGKIAKAQNLDFKTREARKQKTFHCELCASRHYKKDKQAHNDTKKHKNAARLVKNAGEKFMRDLQEVLDSGKNDNGPALSARIKKRFKIT